MVLLAAGAVAAAIVIASVVVYAVTGDELRGQIDASLRQKLTPGPQAVQIRSITLSPAAVAKLKQEGKSPPGGFGGGNLHGETVSIEGNAAFAAGGPAAKVQLPGLPVQVSPFNKLVLPAPRLGGATGVVQLFQSNGQVVRSEGKGSLLPVTAATRAVAAGRRKAFFSDATVGGTHVRVLTERAPEGGVWQVALPLTDVDSTLTHLKLVLALVCLGGIALAAALGLLVSRAALVPVRRRARGSHPGSRPPHPGRRGG
jgi:two-component system sensor histidine kinase MprB